ncbi:MAG: tRNA (adenosine(37)-N6)-dimethylallyltransferase MiaA [Bacteroidia bacterium]
MRNNTLIVIVGPTGVGKTALSILIAKLFSCPIISADSRQFYKEMNIGTAKPSTEEMQGIMHYFINSHTIIDNYNVGKFEKDAIILLKDLFKTNDTVVMAGGSGLYINAVCEGLDELPEADLLVREKIELLFKISGLEGLQKELEKLDPNYYNQVDLNNSQRLIRAIEVCLVSGKTYSSFRKEKLKIRNFKIIKIGLTTSRELLYEKINIRVDEMIKKGLLQEVEKLYPYKDLNSLQTVGYRELFTYLDSLKTVELLEADDAKLLKTAIDLIKQNTRRFAKRQLTWFRKDKEIKWFDPQDTELIQAHLKANIKSL